VARAYSAEFKAPPAAGVTTVDVSHIFVPKPEGDGADPAKAKKLIESVVVRLTAGEPFAAVAAEVSAGPTASDGGRLGKYRPGELDKEIDVVVFSMKAGETSGPIEVGSGFHVFTVHDVIVERDPKVEERIARLRAQLREELLNKQLALWLDSLRQRAYVRVMY
jgi:parvulin-like peptidyl-prolyl isomerase